MAYPGDGRELPTQPELSNEDGSNVFFVFEVADVDRAEAFVQSPDSAKTGEDSGVIDGEYHYFIGHEDVTDARLFANNDLLEANAVFQPPEADFTMAGKLSPAAKKPRT